MRTQDDAILFEDNDPSILIDTPLVKDEKKKTNIIENDFLKALFTRKTTNQIQISHEKQLLEYLLNLLRKYYNDQRIRKTGPLGPLPIRTKPKKKELYNFLKPQLSPIFEDKEFKEGETICNLGDKKEVKKKKIIPWYCQIIHKLNKNKFYIILVFFLVTLGILSIFIITNNRNIIKYNKNITSLEGRLITLEKLHEVNIEKIKNYEIQNSTNIDEIKSYEKKVKELEKAQRNHIQEINDLKKNLKDNIFSNQQTRNRNRDQYYDSLYGDSLYGGEARYYGGFPGGRYLPNSNTSFRGDQKKRSRGVQELRQRGSRSQEFK